MSEGYYNQMEYRHNYQYPNQDNQYIQPNYYPISASQQYPTQQFEVFYNQPPQINNNHSHFDAHHNVNYSSSKCLAISLIITIVYQFLYIISLIFNGFTVKLPWNIILGIFFSIGDLAFLVLTNYYVKKSTKKKKKCKYAILSYISSFILFKLTYLFSFSNEYYLVDNRYYEYSSSLGNIIVQYFMRVSILIFGLIYLNKRYNYD